MLREQIVVCIRMLVAGVFIIYPIPIVLWVIHLVVKPAWVIAVSMVLAIALGRWAMTKWARLALCFEGVLYQAYSKHIDSRPDKTREH